MRDPHEKWVGKLVGWWEKGRFVEKPINTIAYGLEEIKTHFGGAK